MIKLAANTLPNDINTLKSLLHAAQQQLENKDQRILGLQNIIEELIAEKRLAQARQFGASSEKMPLQYYLFDEAEQLDGEALETPIEETSNKELVDVKPHQRRPGGRKPLPEDLPRVRIEHELAAHERQCQCGCTMEKIGEVHCEQIDIIPAQVYVIDHARFKYHCKSCHNTPVVAPLPPQAIPKSQASANLYSLIETAKDNRLNEYAYLKHIFSELPKAQCVEDFEKLLPWNVDKDNLDQLNKYPVTNL